MLLFSLVTRYNNSHARTRFLFVDNGFVFVTETEPPFIHREPFPFTSLGSSSYIQDLLYSHCYEG